MMTCQMQRREKRVSGACTCPTLLMKDVGVSDRGFALAMVMILSAIALGVMAVLIYMLVAGTGITASKKRYKTAFEAGLGGSDLVYRLIALRGETASVNQFVQGLEDAGLTDTSLPSPITTSSSCVTSTTATLPDGTLCTSLGSFTGLATKISLPTSCWSNCGATYPTSVPNTVTPGTASTYDMVYQLGTSPTYTVYARIVDTVLGNTGGDEGLVKSGVVASNSGEVPVMKKPFMYTIEVDSENMENRAERAKFSILYQY
jgi:hypothetical protein